MGFGRAQLGKAVKGRSQPLHAATTANTATTLQQLTEQQLNADITNITLNESQHALHEHHYNRLNELIANEQRYDAVNANIVATVYKQIARTDVVESMRHDLQTEYDKYIQSYQSHTTSVQTLTTTLQQYSSQLQTAQMGHLSKLKLLEQIQNEKLASVEAAFEQELTELITECETELTQLRTTHASTTQYAQQQISCIEAEYNNKVNDLLVSYETEREEVRNRNLEQINELRINLESVIDELEKQFIHTYNIYMDSTTHYNTQYHKLKQDDVNISQQITAKKAQIDKYSGAVAEVRQRLQQHSTLYTTQNRNLQQQKQLVIQYCNQLKQKINALQLASNQSISELVDQCRQTAQHNTSKLEQANKLLTLHQLNAKYETENEQLYGFSQTNSIDAALASSSSSASAPGTANGASEKYNELERFNGKYNKVVLDTVAIKHERQRLLNENAALKQQLQQQLNRTTISDDTVRLDKTLLAVNGRAAGDASQVKSPGRQARQVQYNTVNISLAGV